MPRSTSANATKNSITVASAVRGNLIGASVNAGSASENTLSINAAVIGNITGGQSATGSASHNELTFGKVKVTGDVTGSTGATTEGNIIRLRNTEITGTLTGAPAPRPQIKATPSSYARALTQTAKLQRQKQTTPPRSEVSQASRTCIFTSRTASRTARTAIRIPCRSSGSPGARAILT